MIKYTNAMDACNRMFISTTMIAPTKDLLTELERRGPNSRIQWNQQVHEGFSDHRACGYRHF